MQCSVGRMFCRWNVLRVECSMGGTFCGWGILWVECSASGMFLQVEFSMFCGCNLMLGAFARRINVVY